MIWALLCGLFYGALVWDVVKEEWEKREDERVRALIEACMRRHEDSTAFDLYAVTHTGYEDG